MSRLTKLWMIVVGVVVGSGLLMSAAMACEPAPSHSSSVVRSDLPECVEVEEEWDWVGRLTVINGCEEDLEFEALECGDCTVLVQVEAPEAGADGVRKSLEIEGRRAPELEDETVTTQRYAWLMGDEQGELETEVYFNDTSGACDDWPGGCTASGEPTKSGSNVVLMLLTLVVFLVRGWAGISISRVQESRR